MKTRPYPKNESGKRGRVREWDADAGWGVIDSPQTPGGCFAHYSVLDMDRYRALSPDQDVEFEFELFTQDGYAYRATWVRPAASA